MTYMVIWWWLIAVTSLCNAAKQGCPDSSVEHGCSRSGPSYIQKSLDGRQITINKALHADSGKGAGETLSDNSKVCACVASNRVRRLSSGVPIITYPNFEESDKVSLLEKKSSEVDHWIVMLKPNADNSKLEALCNKPDTGNAKCVEKGHPSTGGIPFVTVEASEDDLDAMLHDETDIADFVEQDTTMEEEPEETYAEVRSWGLDRIDARLGLDGSYTVEKNAGAGVHVYVADGGIRMTHTQFEGRAKAAIQALNFEFIECQLTDIGCAADVRGHGTHVAGIVGGKDYGVAPGVTLHAVKILNDEGRGMWSSFIQAADWVATKGERPAVLVASLSGAGRMASVKAAVDTMVNADVSVVVSAGNTGTSSCERTPAFVPAALTVGSTTKEDKLPYWASTGNCVDLFAPGEAIISASASSDDSPSTKSGSSFAAPHVAGAVALLLGDDKSLTPSDIASRIISSATKDVISNIVDDSPNLLLYVGEDGSPPTPPPTDNSNTDVNSDSGISGGGPGKPCESFCIGECPCLKDWDERCKLRSCSGCAQCMGEEDMVEDEFVEEPTPLPTRYPTLVPTGSTQAEKTESPVPSPTLPPTRPTAPELPETSVGCWSYCYFAFTCVASCVNVPIGYPPQCVTSNSNQCQGQWPGASFSYNRPQCQCQCQGFSFTHTPSQTQIQPPGAFPNLKMKDLSLNSRKRCRGDPTSIGGKTWNNLGPVLSSQACSAACLGEDQCMYASWNIDTQKCSAFIICNMEQGLSSAPLFDIYRKGCGTEDEEETAEEDEEEDSDGECFKMPTLSHALVLFGPDMWFNGKKATYNGDFHTLGTRDDNPGQDKTYLKGVAIKGSAVFPGISIGVDGWSVITGEVTQPPPHKMNWNKKLSTDGNDFKYKMDDWLTWVDSVKHGGRIVLVDNTAKQVTVTAPSNCEYCKDTERKIVVARGDKTIKLSGSRKFGDSIVAPRAHVDASQVFGFVDGFIVAKTLFHQGTDDQLHGGSVAC